MNKLSRPAQLVAHCLLAVETNTVEYRNYRKYYKDKKFYKHKKFKSFSKTGS